ncbi:hypothetical protein DV737_g644, partial [Chaetothyriales sp. CBS 132003]
MGFVQRLVKRLPSAPPVPIIESARPVKGGQSVFRLSFFRRRIRLNGNSSISVPLGFHPSSTGRILVPAGAPPSIRKISEKHDRVFATGCLDPLVAAREPRANAAFVVLARNKELEGVIQSIKSIERHFNRWFNYPYVFLNDGDFEQNFKDTIMNHTSSTVEFGKINSTMWGYPDWVDHEVAREGIRKQGDAAIMYGGMESYHHMCRFYSGFFYKHELLDKYEWYWRLEPEISYFCDITYDPFIEMARANKTYGFTIAVKELKETVPNIFRYASAYKRINGLKSQGLWEMFVEPRPDKEQEDADAARAKTLPNEILQTEPGHQNIQEIDPEAMESETYNMCHFWSNFEIARLDWFRSKEYNDFFEMMDKSGGFWMERWGDAPIHSLAAGALLATKDIHYFRDFGYRHTTIQHCPANAPARQLPRIPWLEKTTEDEKKRQEEDEYWATPDPVKENGVGCRCRCDTDIRDVEGKEGSCLPEWVEVAGGWSSPWASISDAEYSHDEDVQSEMTDAGSLIDLHSATDDQSLRDDAPPASQDDAVHDDDQADVEQPDLRSSTHSRTPAASRFIGPAMQPAEIALDEPDSSWPQKLHVHAVHTLASFSPSEADRLQLRSCSKASHLGTLHMNLSKRPLRHDNRNSFRLLLLGLEYTASLRTCLVNKIADALVASHEEDQACGPPSRYHVVPDSFGPGSQPAAAEVIPIAQTLDVETYHSAILSGEKDGHILLCNDHTMEQAVCSLDKRRAKYAVLTHGWQQPDLAIVVIDSRDSAEAQLSAYSLLVVAKRLNIPTIVLRMDNDWNADLAPLTLTDTDARLCIEERSPSRTRVVRTLPLDLNTFLNVNPAQLGRHVAYLLSVDGMSPETTASESSKPTALDGHGTAETYTAKATSVFKETYAGLQHVAPTRLLHAVAALAATLVLLQCAMFLKASWTTTTPGLIPGLAQDAHSVSSAPTLICTDVLAPVSSATMLEAGRFGNSHILLRVSETLSSLHAASINVQRNHEPIKVETKALFPGLFSIRLDPFQAYGDLNVCLNTSEPDVQECIMVDFEHYGLASWLKQVMMDLEHQHLAAWLKQVIIDLEHQHVAAWLKQVVDSGEMRIQQQLAALRLSLEELGNSDRPREVISEAQKRVLAFETAAFRGFESRWAAVSAWKAHLTTHLNHLGDQAGRNVRCAGQRSHAAVDAAYRRLGSGKRTLLDRLATSQHRAKHMVNRLGRKLPRHRRRA